jgi:hypothetical protein
MSATIRIKPHHFIDIVTSIGAGQRTFEPHPYGHAVHTVSQQVLDDRGTILEMELGADDICEPCIHNIDGLCDDTIDTSFRPEAPASKREWNLIIDQRWCRRLQIANGDRLTATDYCRQVKERAGDIADIYREIPVERTAERQRNLEQGIDLFLARG